MYGSIHCHKTGRRNKNCDRSQYKNPKGIDFAFARVENVSTGEQLVVEAFLHG
jgi:hypothetical protein